LDPNTATLWWAGKELLRSKTLADYVGKNDKTTIIAKLQKKGTGPPMREPPLNEQAQRELMAYYYKKQEEIKVRCVFHFGLIMSLFSSEDTC
jgi:hypothetical protein